MVYFIVSFSVVVCIAIVIIKKYNDLVVKKNRVDNAFCQLDVQMRRRLDLIPVLLEMVSQYTEHAQDLLTTLSTVHKRYLSATSSKEKMEAHKEVCHCLERLCIIMEPYPDFKGSAHLKKLKQESYALEERIISARQFYNDTVLLYNNTIAVFPNNMIASIFHFEEKPYLQ